MKKQDGTKDIRDTRSRTSSPCCGGGNAPFSLDRRGIDAVTLRPEQVRSTVREGYGKVAAGGQGCCGAGHKPRETGRSLGYSDEEMSAVPEGANLGLGCGNPTALASISEGETVVDLGSGAGFDCFLASPLVGRTGRVIGVDMTPEMLDRARENASKGGYDNVEFRLGEIENLPMADNSADIIISNCVINLSPDKERVFSEAFRVLKPGGRLMVSDIVLTSELPADIRGSIQAYIGCVAGAVLKDAYLGAMVEAGFRDVAVQKETGFPVEFFADDPIVQAMDERAHLTREKAESLAGSVVSISVLAKKP